MKKWKEFALHYPKTYLLGSWILLGLLGYTLGFGTEATALVILILGYFLNVIYLMRQ